MRHRIGDAGFHWRHFGCLCISCQKNLYQFFRSHKNRCEVIGTVLFRWLLFCLGFESLWTPNYLLSLAIWERFCSLMCWRIITIILQQRAKYHVIIQTVDVELEMVASRPNGWRRQFLFNIRMFFCFFCLHFRRVRPQNVTPTVKPPTNVRHRIVVMGASGVGKTAIITQFLHGSFPTKHKRTLDEMYHGTFDFSGVSLTLEILDTAGDHEVCLFIVWN